MKIIRAGDKVEFELGRREKHLLLELLKLYPCIPSAHHLQRSNRMPDASQTLLAETLAEQRALNKRQVEAFLADSGRFRQKEADWRLSLSSTELEWLLQILNDIRVGSWIRLGSPEAKLEMNVLNETTAPHFWAMEMAGHFQMELLHSLNA